LKKLLNLKRWLTVADAIRHLSILFGEDVSEADLLQLALEGHLTESNPRIAGAATPKLRNTTTPAGFPSRSIYLSRHAVDVDE
jgi:hypothetical protein